MAVPVVGLTVLGWRCVVAGHRNTLSQDIGINHCSN